MKIFAVVISLLVLVLNGMPCCADDCDSNDSLEQQESNTHNNELCSPFLSCGTCNAVVLLKEEFSKILFLEPVFAQEPFEAEIVRISEFTFRIWQPPKNS